MNQHNVPGAQTAADGVIEELRRNPHDTTTLYEGRLSDPQQLNDAEWLVMEYARSVGMTIIASHVQHPQLGAGVMFHLDRSRS